MGKGLEEGGPEMLEDKINEYHGYTGSSES